MVKVNKTERYTSYKPEEGDVYIPKYDKASEAQRRGPRGAFTAYSVQMEVAKDINNGELNGETIYLTLSGKAQANAVAGFKDTELIVYSYDTQHREGCLSFSSDKSRCKLPAPSAPSLSLASKDKPTVGLEFLEQVKTWLREGVAKDRISDTLQQQGSLSEADAIKLIEYAEE